ncbi:MAG: hypothetical protein ABIA78_00690 [archaeon]
MEVNLGDKPTIFAHDVAISTLFKVEKTKTDKIKKEACTELIFIDAITKKAVARINLPHSTLKALPKLIDDNLNKIKQELKNKEIPKAKVETKSTSASYLS